MKALKLIGSVEPKNSNYSCQVFKVKIEWTRKKVNKIININFDDDSEILFEKVLTWNSTKREFTILNSIFRDIYDLKLKDFLIHNK